MIPEHESSRMNAGVIQALKAMLQLVVLLRFQLIDCYGNMIQSNCRVYNVEKYSKSGLPAVVQNSFSKSGQNKQAYFESQSPCMGHTSRQLSMRWLQVLK
jgi:hypothetical protein